MTPLDKRSCGDCQACCVALKIDLPELRKDAATPCSYLGAKGCGIYAARLAGRALWRADGGHGRGASLRRPALAEYAARLIAQGIPVYLGTVSVVILVNEHLSGQEDVPALRARLLELYAVLEGASWSPWRKIAFLYRLQLDRARRMLVKPRAARGIFRKYVVWTN